MFISNTATAAMMLTFLAPVLKALPADGKGKIGLALAIPIGANIGGMGTLTRDKAAVERLYQMGYADGKKVLDFAEGRGA